MGAGPTKRGPHEAITERLKAELPATPQANDDAARATFLRTCVERALAYNMPYMARRLLMLGMEQTRPGEAHVHSAGYSSGAMTGPDLRKWRTVWYTADKPGDRHVIREGLDKATAEREVLGLVRAAEMVAADRIYAAEPYVVLYTSSAPPGPLPTMP